MSVVIMGPRTAKSGSRVVIMVTGLSSSPKDADIWIGIDGVPSGGWATWGPARGKLTIEVPTKSGQDGVIVFVVLPTGGLIEAAVPLSP